MKKIKANVLEWARMKFKRVLMSRMVKVYKHSCTHWRELANILQKQVLLLKNRLKSSKSQKDKKGPTTKIYEL